MLPSLLPSLLYHANIPTRFLIPHEFPQCPAPWADGPWQDTSDYGEDDFEDEESSAPAPARAAIPSQPAQPAQPAQPQTAAPATQAQACGCIIAFLGTAFGRYKIVALQLDIVGLFVDGLFVHVRV